jgi:hypothetical protein
MNSDDGISHLESLKLCIFTSTRISNKNENTTFREEYVRLLRQNMQGQHVPNRAGATLTCLPHIAEQPLPINPVLVSILCAGLFQILTL